MRAKRSKKTKKYDNTNMRPVGTHDLGKNIMAILDKNDVHYPSKMALAKRMSHIANCSEIHMYNVLNGRCLVSQALLRRFIKAMGIMGVQNIRIGQLDAQWKSRKTGSARRIRYEKEPMSPRPTPKTRPEPRIMPAEDINGSMFDQDMKLRIAEAEIGNLRKKLGFKDTRPMYERSES